MTLKKLSVIFTLALLANACGGGGSSEKKANKTTELMKADLNVLRDTNSYYLEQYDRFNNGVITKVFGGTNGAALTSYYDARIKYALTMDESNDATLNVSGFQYTGWMTDSPDLPLGILGEEERGEVGAINYGMLYWLISIVERVPLVLTTQGREIPIDSSRVGIMVFGPGYSETMLEENEGGDVVRVPRPVESRNSILVHEARHSDCTGGVSDADLEPIRTARNRSEFLKNYKKINCGHLHTLCPVGHSFAGITACDRQPWGAYAIGTIYSKAVVASLEGKPRRRVEAMIIDQVGRLQFSYQSMIDGLLGEPNMTSSGVTGQ